MFIGDAKTSGLVAKAMKDNEIAGLTIAARAGVPRG
jgi:hypothetical protein